MKSDEPVLVVDDEPAIRLLLTRALERSDFQVIEAPNGAEALRLAEARRPALVILDLGLPDRDGLELIAAIKALGAAVLVLTAREAVSEKVAALDLGADDYLVKPFDSEELLARVRTCLRHRLAARGEQRRVVVGDVEIDLAARLVRKRGEEVHLAPKEYTVLAELARHAGKVVTHQQLLQRAWGGGHLGDIEYLRVAIRSIRQKLEEDPAEPRLIRNEPAVGYRLAEVI